MKYYPYTSSSEIVSIEAANEYFDQNVVDDQNSTAEKVMPMFASLCRNQSAILSSMAICTKGLLDGSGREGHVPNSMILFRGNGYVVRVNVWPALDQDKLFGKQAGSLYAYGLPHNHNYSFLTGVVLGGGYETTICSWKNVDTRLQEGDEAVITEPKNIFVEPGGVYLYEKFTDVHIQIPPKDLTVTLNLMLTKEETLQHPQFVFDLDNRRIHSLPEYSALAKQAALLRLVRREYEREFEGYMLGLASDDNVSHYIRKKTIELAGPNGEFAAQRTISWRNQQARELANPASL